MIDRNTPLCGVQGKDSGWLSFCTAVLLKSLAEDRVEWSVCEKWGWNCVLSSLAFNGGAYICIWGGNFCGEKRSFYGVDDGVAIILIKKRVRVFNDEGVALILC